jgi:hypothetical protein
MCYLQCNLDWNLSVMKGTLLMKPKDFFIRISHRIAVGLLKYGRLHSQHVLRAVQVRLKLESSEGYFTLETATVFLPHLLSYESGVRGTSHSLSIRYEHCNLGWNQLIMNGTLLLSPIQFFVPISRRIAVGLLKHATWHFLRMRYIHGKLGWSRSLRKGSLLYRP